MRPYGMKILFYSIVLLVTVTVFGYVTSMNVSNVKEKATIDLDGKDDVKIKDIEIETEGRKVTVKFEWEKKTIANPGEIDQIFLAVERKVVAKIYNGIPGTEGVKEKAEVSFDCDLPSPGKSYTLYVAMTPSPDWKRAIWHYEVEKGGHRVAIATLQGQE